LRFSTTGVVLAALTEAPVMSVFCQMLPDGHYQIEFCPAFQVPRDATQTGQTGFWVQHFLQMLEEQVRNYPTSSNDYFFWKATDEQVA
jgi:lauroyl/myristoyl acyltransferase